MSKRKKAAILTFGKKRGFGNHRLISTATGTGTATKAGVLHLDGVTAGVANGAVYLAVDTAGTGTQISP